MRKVGVEGTGSYGAGLSRFLRTAGLTVIEVNRPNREERRRSGKSDPLDAIEAARAALGGKAKSIAKSKDGAVEGIRALVVAKRSGRVARTAALIQMRPLIVTAPTCYEAVCGAERGTLTTKRPGCADPDRRLGAKRDQGLVVLARAPGAKPRRRARRLDARIEALLCPPAPSSSAASASDPTLRPRSWSVPGTTPSASTPSPPGRTCGGRPRPGRLREDLRTGPARSRRRPAGQRRALAHRHGPHRPPP